MNNNSSSLGQMARQSEFQPGDRVQLTDSKGRMHTIHLTEDGFFQSHRASIFHRDIIGLPEGSIVTTREGKELLCLRPLLADYVLSMPRGAAIIYPKDAGQIIAQADIFPGARVLEAGAGSGALSLSLLSAIGEDGSLISVEKRPEFAQIARSNVDLWFGRPHRAWDLRIGDLAEQITRLKAASLDRVVLDMLDPWNHLDQSARVLRPGGVLCCYVTTVSQMSRLAEEIRATGCYTPLQAFETTQRHWHLEGLAVRPEHRMIAHTGFLVIARTLAEPGRELQRRLRPAKEAEDRAGQWDDTVEWGLREVGQRPISDRKVRRVARQVSARAQKWVETPSAERGSADAEPEGEDIAKSLSKPNLPESTTTRPGLEEK